MQEEWHWSEEAKGNWLLEPSLPHRQLPFYPVRLPDGRHETLSNS